MARFLITPRTRHRGLYPALVIPSALPPQGTQSNSFTEDTTSDFMNPERGWMIREGHTTSAFANARDGDTDNPVGYSVVWAQTYGTAWNGTPGQNPFRLDNYRDTDTLPQSLHTELGTVFANARTAGIKLKVRFMYNYHEGDDAPMARMVTHIEQLAPTINANRDAIASMDAGFIGHWGEWHASTRLVEGMDGEGNPWWLEPWITARNTVLSALLNNIHPNIHIGMRYPRGDMGIRAYYTGDTWQMPLPHRWQEATYPQGRVGWYNDSFANSWDDTGTYQYESDKAVFQWVGQYAATSGETWGLSSYNECGNVIPYCESQGGPDHFFRKHGTDVINRWKTHGCYDEFSRRMGYRLWLSKAETNTGVSPGGSMSLKLWLFNRGFGKVYNPRPIDLVFVGAGGPFTARVTADARLQLPRAGYVVTPTWNLAVPAGLQAGQSYALHLRLPDPDVCGNGLAADARYCVRLASAGTWDGDTGRHDLGLSVTVSS